MQSWFGKQESSSRLRVHQLAAVPSVEDLQFLLSRAQRNWRTAVELAWQTGDSPLLFRIIVKCTIGTGEPVWTLASGEDPEAQILWTYTTSDVLLMHNLIALESTRAEQEAPAAEAEPAGGISARAMDSFAESTRKAQGPGATAPPIATSAPAPAAASPDEPAQEAVPPEAGAMAPPPTRPAEAPGIDRAAVEAVLRSLTSTETGALSESALLFFLEQESVRFKRGGLPFSLALLEMRMEEDGSRKQLPPAALRQACSRILATKRELDMLGHHGFFDFAVLLPHTDTRGAAVFAQRIVSLLSAEVLAKLPEGARLCIHFGIAGMPETSSDPAALLADARAARDEARERREAIVTFQAGEAGEA